MEDFKNTIENFDEKVNAIIESNNFDANAQSVAVGTPQKGDKFYITGVTKLAEGKVGENNVNANGKIEMDGFSITPVLVTTSNGCTFNAKFLASAEYNVHSENRPYSVRSVKDAVSFAVWAIENKIQFETTLSKKEKAIARNGNEYEKTNLKLKEI